MPLADGRPEYPDGSCVYTDNRRLRWCLRSPGYENPAAQPIIEVEFAAMNESGVLE
jgi:hypothetical protein